MSDKEVKIKVYATLSVLEEAADLLFDLGLEKLVGLAAENKDTEVNFMKIIKQLLKERKLRELLNIITKNELGDTDLDITNCVELISGFFLGIMKSVGNSKGLLQMVKNPS